MHCAWFHYLELINWHTNQLTDITAWGLKNADIKPVTEYMMSQLHLLDLLNTYS